ncbi:transcriptional regulator, MarR family [Segniliparus rotundus DSM 44985]|uniref:Transcriptional regulator, MarR family n=1 Tax=Segniliparus rotundus (strain ATCC BAA-972 / CDC 1076 / CIP 108378 / DSM 44985 / JCM 13578) TaxID=640132 RepID=D6ZAI1_SEGRD|nr:MarR family transcriptional regulator [Segniliparus rotundus]ADG96723.1 transcriptional regulator, MarR family [Segniliparus rotundus DSM 44985]
MGTGQPSGLAPEAKAPFHVGCYGDAADVFYLLLRILRGMRRAGDMSSLTVSGISALFVIAQHGPLRLGDLANRERVTAPTMSRVVTLLEQAELVQREPDPADGRATLLSLTPQGSEYVAGDASEKIKTVESALATLSDEEQKQVVRWLQTLEAAVAKSSPEVDDDLC